MTDGIIQQVLEPYLTEWHEIVCECRQEDPDSEYTKRAEHRLNQLMKIQQELIEKIEQNSKSHSDNSHDIIYIKDLIGDNQE